MINKTLFFALFFVFLFISNLSIADDEELTIRHLPNGNYEAVLSLNTGMCIQVNPASSVQVVGSEVLVESPSSVQIPCVFFPQIFYYEMTALIGELAPGQYHVTWTQPDNFSWSTSYDVRPPSKIPTSSLWSLLLLVLGVVAVAFSAIRYKNYSMVGLQE
jgi:hypothetical protein